MEEKTRQFQERIDELTNENAALNEDLLQLDAQHEEALNKVLAIKNELQANNRKLNDELQFKKKQYSASVANLQLVIEQIQRGLHLFIIELLYGI